MGILAQKLTQKLISDKDFQILAENIRKRILSVSQPSRIIIFGSYAQKTVHELSDIDIAILFSDKETAKNQKKTILNSKLFLDQFVDLIFYTEEDFTKKSQLGGVCTMIEKEGVVIYDQKTFDWAMSHCK